MTPFVQPCDAGIIWCFKALYCRNFSRQAIDLDEGGECEIYKIDLLEAMEMANEAWNSVMPETIRNCWNHTHIQPLPSSSQSTSSHTDPLAWKIIYEFAMTDLSLPNAEIYLQAHLGNRFIDADCQPALWAVMDAEGDPQAAVLAIKPLEQAAMHRPGLKIHISLLPKDLPQLKSVGDELAQSINELEAQNCIFDTLPTLDEVLDPPEE
ncbi:DDE-domain-containing protein, partial [Gyrodon lividus]